MDAQQQPQKHLGSDEIMAIYRDVTLGQPCSVPGDLAAQKYAQYKHENETTDGMIDTINEWP